jgi:hypothetical protein
LQSPYAHVVKGAPKVWLYIQNERLHYQHQVEYSSLQDLTKLQLFDHVAELTNRSAEDFEQLTFQYAHRDEDILVRHDEELSWEDVKENVAVNARFARMADARIREIEVLVGVGSVEVELEV